MLFPNCGCPCWFIYSTNLVDEQDFLATAWKSMSQSQKRCCWIQHHRHLWLWNASPFVPSIPNLPWLLVQFSNLLESRHLYSSCRQPSPAKHPNVSLYVIDRNTWMGPWVSTLTWMAYVSSHLGQELPLHVPLQTKPIRFGAHQGTCLPTAPTHLVQTPHPWWQRIVSFVSFLVDSILLPMLPVCCSPFWQPSSCTLYQNVCIN